MTLQAIIRTLISIRSGPGALLFLKVLTVLTIYSSVKRGASIVSGAIRELSLTTRCSTLSSHSLSSGTYVQEAFHRFLHGVSKIFALSKCVEHFFDPKFVRLLLIDEAQSLRIPVRSDKLLPALKFRPL